MNGSEKQIKWANEIKETFISGVIAGGTVLANGIEAEIETQKATAERYVQKYERKGKNIAECKNFAWAKQDLSRLEKLLIFVNNCEDSVWFIENKDATKSVLELARKMY